jgi:FHS family L-fucose permease-like MFS transporter
MFPTIFALGIKDLGPHTKEGASLIVMSIIGGAVFTPLMGVAFQMTKSMAISMCVPLICYAIVAGYAFWGSRFAHSPRFSQARLSEVPND